MFVHEVMTREPSTVTPETALKRATEMLATQGISSLPVLDEKGRLCGVVSEADLIRDAFAPDARGHAFLHEGPDQARARTVEEVMTPHAITVHESNDIADVAELMTSTGVKCLPVVDDDRRLVGVVSRSDLVKVRARRDDVIEREVDARLVAMGHGDWLVEVTEGDVEIDGPSTDIDRSIARVTASTIPGVTTVTVR